MNFGEHYRLFSLIACICFCCGIGILTLFAGPAQQPQGLTLAIEILLYGMLWVVAIPAFFLGLEYLGHRMKVPGIVSAVVFLGCTAYAVLSRNDQSGHIFSVGLVLALLALSKGLLGPLAAALSLSLAAYGILHTDGYHVPLIKGIVEFIFGQINVALEYVTSFIIAVSSLGNMLASDTDVG